MRIFMSVDMEGITGVASGAALSAGANEYERFRLLMTQDVNAAVEGAVEAGADEYVLPPLWNTGSQKITWEPGKPDIRVYRPR